MKENLISMYQRSFREHMMDIALSDYHSKKDYTYGDLARHIRKIHIMYGIMGIRKGDKIALGARNNPQWVTVYIATITYGAVIVPILQNFSPEDTRSIIAHSDAKILFTNASIFKAMGSTPAGGVEAVIETDNCNALYTSDSFDFEAIKKEITGRFAAQYYTGFGPDDVQYDIPDPDSLMTISYTSGTSGFSKGVMLSVRNISVVVQFAIDHKMHFPGSRTLAILPLAHAYGCAFDMLTPLATGSTITMLGKMPTPAVLMEALKAVRPHLVCTVPLIVEKLLKKNVFPILEKQPVKFLTKVPGIRKIVWSAIRRKLLDAFGGCMIEMNMGGAALSHEADELLHKIKFPYTIGYGMTECAPLISYAWHDDYLQGSCGRLLPWMEARLEPVDGGSASEGEICVKGENVMLGYYKNPEATAAVIDADGWLHTGDVGRICDPFRTVYLCGRCKSMILTANGQNIYPEEIESKLNECECVAESLVVEEDGRLVALVYPNLDEVRKNNWSFAHLKEVMERNLQKLNLKVASYEKISAIRLCAEEFEKTPKQSIRRYLYPRKARLLTVL
ncbi:MAG: AMP-binding protein [Bacteroidales bacterium]|nr:AMP-binding protein [Candidatus Equibacterium intestinale]